MTDAETHRLLGELKGTLAQLAIIVERVDSRSHATTGEVAEMRAQISALSRTVDRLLGPVQASSIAEARMEGGDEAVAAASAQRMDIIRTVTAVAGVVATLVSMVVGAIAYVLTRNGGTP